MSELHPTPDPLEVLVDDVAELSDPTGDGPVAALAGLGPAGLELCALHPLHELTGMVAPPDVAAVVVVATGRAHAVAAVTPSAPGPTRAHHTPPADGDQVGVVFGMDRRGSCHARLRVGGNWMATSPDEGRIPDTVRRVLDRPTAPPPAGPARLVAALWAGAVMQRMDARRRRGSGRPLAWAAAVACHPLRELTPAASSPRWASGEVSAALDASVSWERLRTLTVAGRGSDEWCPPALAAWMDEGMFARHVLDGLLPDHALLGAVTPDLTPRALAGFAAAIGVSPVSDRWRSGTARKQPGRPQAAGAVARGSNG